MGPKHVLIAPASPYQDGRPTSSRSNLSSPDPRLTPFVPPEYSGARPMPPGSMLPHEEAQLQAEHQRKRSASIQACSSDPKRQSLELTRPFEQLMAQPQGPHTGPLITEKIYQNRDTEEPLNKFLLHRFVKETPGWLTSSGSKRFECCTHVNRTIIVPDHPTHATPWVQLAADMSVRLLADAQKAVEEDGVQIDAGTEVSESAIREKIGVAIDALKEIRKVLKGDPAAS